MGRAPCCEKSGLKKGPWTPEEDEKLIDYIQKHGYGNWRTLPKNAGLQRCGKSCRLRWTNYLRPDIKRGRFSFEEEETIIQLHGILGNKWSAIASRLPGRTDNEIKNYWNTHIRKRLLRMGIDPVTHSPRLDLLDLSSLLSSSLYSNSSQPNIQRFLGMQPLLNPELLKLASSLIQSQNNQQNQLFNPQIQSQIPHFGTDPVQEIPASLPLSEAEAQLMSDPNVDAYQSNFTDFDWQGNAIASSYVPQFPSCNFNSSDNQNLMSEVSNFQYSNGRNQNFSFASVLSTPSSSPTPLNSNSTYVNSCSTEDDREISYGGSCNDILRFEIPDILDVNEFM